MIELTHCEPGEYVELRPEPHNKHDSRAIAVFSARGIQIGYLRADDAPRIGQLIHQGAKVQAVFQQSTSWGAFIRATFDGNTPVLRPDFPPDVEPEFEPDPEWPDE